MAMQVNMGETDATLPIHLVPCFLTIRTIKLVKTNPSKVFIQIPAETHSHTHIHLYQVLFTTMFTIAIVAREYSTTVPLHLHVYWCSHHVDLLCHYTKSSKRVLYYSQIELCPASVIPTHCAYVSSFLVI